MCRIKDYRLPSIDALLAFEAAVQKMSFDSAAESLSVTSSALRKRISGLEQRLGVSLFNRSGGTLTITTHGQAYLEQITPILEQLLAIPMHSRLTQRKQRLCISSPPTFARQILVPRLSEYGVTHPHIDLQLELSAPLACSIRGAWDISISGDSASVASEYRLLNERLQPLAAPDLLSKFNPLHFPDDISRIPLLRSPLEPWRPWFNEASLDLPEPNEGVLLLDLGIMLEAAANGLGVVLARPSFARPWLANGQLVPVGKIRSAPSFHYEVSVYRPSEAASEFVVWLKQICYDAVSSAEIQLAH